MGTHRNNCLHRDKKTEEYAGVIEEIAVLNMFIWGGISSHICICFTITLEWSHET